MDIKNDFLNASLFATQKMHEIAKEHDYLIFVFGSNLAGRHGAGAAAEAHRNWGAVMGQGVGQHGLSYAIPTKTEKINTMGLQYIKPYVDDFLLHAKQNPEYLYMVTQVGCGLAGYDAKDIAPMFDGAPPNCSFDTAWLPYLGARVEYWGHV